MHTETGSTTWASSTQLAALTNFLIVAIAKLNATVRFLTLKSIIHFAILNQNK
jgi:hypothetical protein